MRTGVSWESLSGSSDAFDADVQLSSQQRALIIAEADRLCRLDWSLWLLALVHFVTVCVAIVWVGVYWYWTGQLDPIVLVPSLVFPLVLTRHRRFAGQAHHRPWMMGVYALLTALLILLMTLFHGWPALVVNLGVMSSGIVIMEIIWRRAMRPYVRTAMCDLGLDEVCLRCGYRLHGLAKNVVQCPECGEVRYSAKRAAE